MIVDLALLVAVIVVIAFLACGGFVFAVISVYYGDYFSGALYFGVQSATWYLFYRG